MADPIDLKRMRDAEGNIHVQVQQGNAHGILPLRDFALGNKTLVDRLSAYGIVIFDKDELKQLIEQVRLLDGPDELLATRSGWQGDAYVLKSGKALTATGIVNLPVNFPTQATVALDPVKVTTFKRDVTKKVVGYPLFEFALGLPFAAMLLKFMPAVGNRLVEIVGPSSIGKSALQRVAAAASPSTGPLDSAASVVPLETFLKDPRAVIEQHGDQLLVIDHAAAVLATSTAKSEPAIYRQLAHEPAGCNIPHLALISGHMSVRKLAPSAATIGDPVITLRMDGPQGVFVGRPLEGGAAPFAENLVAAADANRGQLVPQFGAKLLASDRADLQSRLDSLQGEFLVASGVGRGDGVTYRGARFFGGVYAALKEAQRRGVLPKAFQPLASCLYCFKLWKDAEMPAMPFVDRLREMIADGKLLTVSRQTDRANQIQSAKAALGTVHMLPDRMEVRMKAENAPLAFLDWLNIEGTEEVRSIMKKEGRGYKPYNQLAPGMPKERLFCFVLPPPRSDDLFNTADPASETDAGEASTRDTSWDDIDEV